MVYSIARISTTKYSCERAVFKLGFEQNALKRIIILLKSKCFFILNNEDNFPFAIRQRFFKRSSNFNSLTKSLTVLNSHIPSLPILAHKCSNLLPTIKR